MRSADGTRPTPPTSPMAAPSTASSGADSMAEALAAIESEAAFRKPRHILPGFGLTLGFTLVYLSLIVLIPLSAAFLRTFELGWAELWSVVTAPRVLASLRVSFGASILAACVNLVFGLIVA